MRITNDLLLAVLNSLWQAAVLADAGDPPPDLSGPSLVTALRERLGLELKPSKGSVEVLVIDHAEKPEEN
jgi:uncharacterized protein (TIGR03435 family)